MFSNNRNNKAFIPYGRQSISEDDIAAVVKVLRSEWLTQGPLIKIFESKIASYCGANYGVAVCNATSALHLACRTIGLEQSDRLWTSPNTFVASANCGLYCGAEVDFVDINPRTYNMCIDALLVKLEKADKSGTLPKVVIPVHFAGQSCDMAAIARLAKHYGFYVIEDASHAVGGSFQGGKIGCCQYSDITVFSFHPVKIITTGEGGMALTNDAQLAKRMRLLRSHGITSDAKEMSHVPDGSWYYQQIDLGYNYRMADLQAALGLSQMQRLDEFVSKRHTIAKRYDQLLTELPVLTPWQQADSYSGLHLYVIRLKLAEISKTHSEVFDAMRAAGIGVNLHYVPVYRQPYYKRLGFKEGHCPEAEQYYAEAVSLPMYPRLTEAQQDRVVTALREATST